MHKSSLLYFTLSFPISIISCFVMARLKFMLLTSILLCLNPICWSETDPNDFAILQNFQKGLDNLDVLNWPRTGSDPCGDSWPYIFCDGPRITQIQTKNLQLRGTLPQDFNKLTELANLGLQNNELSGSLPSFAGLSKLQYAFLGNNKFNTIPSDFFNGLTSLQVISIQNNPLNQSTGWAFPTDLKDSVQLTNLSLSGCNLVGPLPDFLGSKGSLMSLDLSYNSLSGEIPTSYSGLQLQILKLNNQVGPGLSGPIDVITSMTQLTLLWLHGNSFTGQIPDGIGQCTSLRQVWLNDNQLVGLIPDNLTSLPELESLQLQNNKLMGPIPEVTFSNFIFLPNSFCQSTPGVPCLPEVTALLPFLGSVNYPQNLVTLWSGNDPCSWFGVSCLNNKVSRINLPSLKLNGTISPSLGKLDSVTEIILGGNNLTGRIPNDFTSLHLLKLLNLSDNDIGPPVPNFSSSVKLLVNGNPQLDPTAASKTLPESSPGTSEGSSKPKLLVIVALIIVGLLLILLVVLFICYRRKRKKGTFPTPISNVIHPRDSSNPDSLVEIVVANNDNNCVTSSDLLTSASSGTSDTNVIESGNLVVSVQILRNVKKNFSAEQVLGCGGFGVANKGGLHDGTHIAVKRMESGVLSNKGI